MRFALPTVCVAIVLSGALPVQEAVAAEKLWDGGAGTAYWHDANNWSPDGVPGPGDMAHPDGGTPEIVAGDDLTNGTFWVQTTVQMSGGTLRVTDAMGGPGYAGIYLNGQTFAQSGGTVIQTHAWGIGNGNGMANYWGSGHLRVSGAASVTISNGFSCEAGALTVSGHEASIGINSIGPLGWDEKGWGTFTAVLDADARFSTVNVTNAVELGRGGVNTSLFQLQLATGFSVPPDGGQQWTIIHTGSGFGGFGRFGNVAEGDIITTNNYRFKASYLSNSGRDFTLSLPVSDGTTIVVK
jgi:hypothetical protein